MYYLSDRTGWWNLYRHDGTAVAPMAADCAAPPWELGYSSYGFLDDGRIVMIAREGPAHRLVLVGEACVPVPLPYTSIKPCLAVAGSSVALVGAAPDLAPQVAVADLAGDPPRLTVIDGAGSCTDAATPYRIDELRALVYPPAGAADDWSAPLIVRAHPGPTACSVLRLDPQVQFFTSRGYAVADVDYTGSAGYGRAFREDLNGRWGTADVADCAAVAAHLLDAGRTRPGQVFIRGASAGGYTALRAVSQDGPFAAAVAVAAVVDPAGWAAPRFHRPQVARLGGDGVTAAQLRTPVLLVHGTEDAVVPAGPVVKLAAELGSLGRPHELVLIEGAGHDATDLAAELRLYERVLGRS
ncbi:prolyl oligopeptidase family serine peptidase [Dactylosporangium aurantiacum]|uniref:Prolyl oligopeptidase family serine peptidase n=1 Tax=Dactylosporangium aurantiacum TaxID=35754 RepID=A0A9Q9IN91_9ACTN|nr:prolyl oligopeptidase family serine peptidase [Dactylosporangium aurantiacum]